MEACKHGHVDGVNHIPCPHCQTEYWQGQVNERDETIRRLLKEIDTLNKKLKEKKTKAKK